MPIQYLKYETIDKQKWDNCIEHSTNGLIYAYSFYLDTMSANWDALVLNDYEAVMPLTWKKKYNVHYLYQPFFTACLGVFGKNISAELLNDFLKGVPAKFKYWDIYLNHGNFFSLANFKLYERMNYVLLLQNDYEKLFSSYRDNIKRNIKKAEQLNCVVKKDIDVKEVIALAKEQSKSFSPVTDKDYQQFHKSLSSIAQAATKSKHIRRLHSFRSIGFILCFFPFAQAGVLYFGRQSSEWKNDRRFPRAHQCIY